MDISLDDITDGSIEGTGTFDVLMKSIKSHLHEEFTANRIRGAEYAKVYLASINTTLQQSIGFILQEQIADKQANLLQSQIDKQNRETTLLDKQEELLQAQIDLIAVQISKAEKENELLDQQKDKLIAETLLITEQTAMTANQTRKMGFDATLSEKSIPIKDVELKAATANLVTISKSQDKLDSEIAILIQKKVTERAQTEDIVDSLIVAGVIGKQKDLYQAQIAGFQRDAEQKASRIFTDAFSMSKSVDEGLEPGSFGYTDINTKAILSKMAEGIDVTLT